MCINFCLALFYKGFTGGSGGHPVRIRPPGGERIAPAAGRADALQEASMGLSGYACLRHPPHALDCPRVVDLGIRGPEQHLLRPGPDRSRSRVLLPQEGLSFNHFLRAALPARPFRQQYPSSRPLLWIHA